MSNTDLKDELKPEYDLKQLRVRKFGASRTAAIVLDKDVSEVFHDSDSVNQALRFLIRITKEHKAELAEK